MPRTSNPTGLDLSLIGASDVATVLGMDDRNSPMALVARLVHGIDPQDSGLEWAGAVGRYDEEPIARMLLDELDRVDDDLYKPVSRVKPAGREWQRYSLDFVTGLAMVQDNFQEWFWAPTEAGQPQDIIEAKLREWSSFSTQGWSSVDGTDGVPDKIMLQVQVQLEAVSYDRDWWKGSDIPDAEHAYVACRVGAFDLHWYKIQRNRELGEIIAGRCEEFWKRYVVGDEVPPLDGHDATRRYLRALNPRPSKDWLPAGNGDLELLHTYKEARATAEVATKEKKRVENLIIERIGGKHGLDFGKAIGRIAYRPEGGRTSNAKVLSELAQRYEIPADVIEELKDKHRGKASRKFDARLK